MRNRLGLLVVVCLSLVGCAQPSTATRCAEPEVAAAAETSRASAEASLHSRVFVVRHAEKADDGTKDPPLLPEGVVRATCLARALSDLEVTHVFATDLQRTEATVRPTAAAHGVEVATLPASDTEALAKALRALPAGSIALVAGHSNTIPNLATLLGAPLSGLNDRGHIPEQEHDRLIEVVLADGVAAAPTAQLRYCSPSPRES
ncbi:MAG: SixA phosphatase family protein [Nannocystales bacterium]